MNHAAPKPMLLAHDANIPQRDDLLDSGSMSNRLGKRLELGNTSCQIARVKYRFGANLRVLYDLNYGERSILIAARTFTGAAKFDRQRQMKMGEARSAPDFVDEDLKAVFWIFPNDRKIANLGILTRSPESLADLSAKNWERSSLAAYAPEKCATARCLGPNGETVAYAKMFSGDDGLRIFRLYRQFGSAISCVPRALSYSPRFKTLILKTVPGTRVSDLDNGFDDVYREFGSAIARFHRLNPPANLNTINRLDPARMPHVLQTIINARPDLAFQAARLSEKLSGDPLDCNSAVCIHGDVHAKNAIWDEGKLTLIDLDQVSIGDPAIDIGSFLANLYYREIVGSITTCERVAMSKNFLLGYGDTNSVPSENRLRRYTAAALFAERARRAVTRVRRDGLENMGRLLDTAECILNGGEL